MTTHAFIDAANLFYSRERWIENIDHQKLIDHLRNRYNAAAIFYFSGVEMHKTGEMAFYRHLASLGYTLHLKPVKYYRQRDGFIKKKANCDVDITFLLMKEQNNFDRLIFLSGDGDFLPVLKYLHGLGKEIIIIAKERKTAREIRKFFGNNFINMDIL